MKILTTSEISELTGLDLTELGSCIIQIGQNAKENDQLVKKANQNDLWFHLQGMSSPHVILKASKGLDPPSELIHLAACQVKFHSKMKKNASKIKVNYLQAKYVKRTSTPGLVTLQKKANVIAIKDIKEEE